MRTSVWSRALSSAVLLTAVALLLYAATATRTITSRFGGADGAELAAVALSGGVAHPSGYPTYLLLARLFLLLPWGEPAARLALLSAMAAALAVGCTVLIGSFRIPRDTSNIDTRALAAAYAGLTLMLSERVWSQAIIVEVYAVYLFGLALCSLFTLAWLASDRTWLLLVGALAFGLTVGAHLTAVVLAPAALLAAWATSRRPSLPATRIAATTLAVVAGLALHGLLPLWAAREAIPSWGDQRTVGGFWSHVTGSEYRYLVGIVPPGQRLERFSFVASDLLRQPGAVATLLAIWAGIPTLWRVNRPLLALTGSVALLAVAFAASYGAADGTVYLLPWTWAWSLWAGAGLAAVDAQLAPLPWARVGRVGLRIVVAATLIWMFLQQRGHLDLHADTTERDRVVAVLGSLPSGALLVTNTDADTFGAWYVQGALGYRTDVVVVDERLLGRAWYRTQIARTLGLLDERLLCDELLARSAYRIPTPAQNVTAATEYEC